MSKEDDYRIELATLADVVRLSRMSRDYIEHGLGWSWREERVQRAIRSPDNVVIVARGDVTLGFAIMYFGLEEARLNLLAVEPACRRRGVARDLLNWLEDSALVAGVSIVYLEVRSCNHPAQLFYQSMGYRPVQHLQGYYQGEESALRMAKDLWSLGSSVPKSET